MTPEEKSNYFRELALKRKNPYLGFKDKKKAKAAQLKSAEKRKQNAKKEKRPTESQS